MALKSWEEMRKIDVTPYCQERDGMDVSQLGEMY